MTQKSVSAVENLGSGNIVTLDGDVLPEENITDGSAPMPNEHRIARMHPHRDPETDRLDSEPKVASDLGKVASRHELSDKAREQANYSVDGFVMELSPAERSVVLTMLDALYTWQEEYRESLRPRIHQQTRDRHKAVARDAADTCKALLEELTGTSSNPRDDDRFLAYGWWKKFFSDNRKAIIQAIQRQEEFVDPDEKERDDDRGITRW